MGWDVATEKSFHMKKVFFYLLLCFTLQAQAQGILPEGFEHVIDVARYSDWGKGYLTITDFHAIGITEGDFYYHPLTYEYVDEGKNLGSGMLVLEVDGLSAAGWSPSQFYAKVDNRHDVITLKLRHHSDGDVIVKIRPIYEIPDKFKPYAGVFGKLTGSSGKENRESHYKNNKNNIVNNERYDRDFDFFACKTYDYLITSNDPLLDKSILDKMAPPSWIMERDEKNPDILFTIARNADESISTTYIPPTSRTVNVGSKTTTQYNYILKQNEYVTTQKNRTITEGGYTKETKTADLFLEIAALDAKRVNDPKMTHPPVVWQSTTKRHVLNPNFNYDDELHAYASWYTFPPIDREVCEESTVYAPLGVIFDNNDPKIITAVKSGSRAEMAGLKPGDKLLKAEDVQYGDKDIKKSIKKSGWKVLEEWSWTRNRNIEIEIQRDGKKTKMTLAPLSLKVCRFYWK